MKISLQSRLSSFNVAFILGLSTSFLALAHIPSRVQSGVFDRNAAPQFIVLCLIGITASLYLLIKGRLSLSPVVGYSIAALFGFTLISLLLSDSFTTSLVGDTGRYSGLASLWSLLAIALTATFITSKNFRDALLGLSVGIILVTVLGFIQTLNGVNLPTGGGVGSTLGNLDFLSAWVGTTFLIFALTFREFFLRWQFTALYLVLSLFVLWKIDAKQGYVDIALIALFVALFQIYIRLGISGITPKAWKAIVTFLFLLWSEAIYLIPMAKIPFPGVSDDPQVSIRADFWYSASQMFVQHIGFGVGPDNYGNYYEKFRSLNSVKTTEFVLANDAHSSMLQTFATLGIFATLTFLVLILLVLFSAIDLYAATKNRRYLILILAFFIFYTNALISPITLPNKAIFWLIAGFLIGENIRQRSEVSDRNFVIRTWIPSTLVVLTLVTALVTFTPSFLRINSALAANNAGQMVSYEVSDSLPCIVYTNAQLNLVQKSGGDVRRAAEEIRRNHPRCLDALSFLAQDALSKKDYRTAKPFIYQLLDVAPARQSVVRLAAIYAMGSGDEYLKNILTSQGLKLGILTESQIK
jgi:O-antigen ligase